MWYEQVSKSKSAGGTSKYEDTHTVAPRPLCSASLIVVVLGGQTEATTERGRERERERTREREGGQRERERKRASVMHTDKRWQQVAAETATGYVSTNVC